MSRCRWARPIRTAAGWSTLAAHLAASAAAYAEPPVTAPVAPPAPPGPELPAATVPPPVTVTPPPPVTVTPAPPRTVAPSLETLGAPAPLVAMAPPPGAPDPAADRARVHITTTTRAVVLERRVSLWRVADSARASLWLPVCAAPCDAAVELRGDYRIAGEGVTPSRAFSLHGPATDLQVDAGSYPVRRAGVLLTVIGAVGAVVSGTFLALSAYRPADQATGRVGASGYASIGGLVGGSVLGVGGVGMMVGGGTTVHDESRRTLARMAPPSVLRVTFHF